MRTERLEELRKREAEEKAHNQAKAKAKSKRAR